MQEMAELMVREHVSELGRFNVSSEKMDLVLKATGSVGITRAVETTWRFVAIDETQ